MISTVSGFIQEALKAVYEGDDLAALRVRKAKVCRAAELGQGGMGCG